MDEKSKIAVVTGGAEGLGRALGRKFASQGINVVLGDINYDKLCATAEEIEKEYGVKAVPVKTDVSKRDDVMNMAETAVSNFGRIDILCNNAGMFTLDPFDEITEDTWDRMMNVNARGVLWGIQAVVPVMIKQGGGRIVNTASVAGKIGRPLLASYCATKSCVISLTQSAALSFAPYGITVNCVCPGVIKTTMGKLARDLTSQHGDVASIPPIGRVAEPEDIAKVINFLVSSEGAYLTGQAINVDGGRIMH